MTYKLISKAKLEDMCEDIEASFPEKINENAITSLIGIIMKGVANARGLGYPQLDGIRQSIELWYEKMEKDDQERYWRVYHYVSQQIKDALVDLEFIAK